MNSVAATQDEMRRNNVGRLLRLLHIRGPTSRARLTALTGLNRSTVRAITTELADAGLVRESAPVGRGRAGRPSIVVEPASAGTFAVALDIGVEHLIAARIGLGGVVLARHDLHQVGTDHDVHRTLDRAQGLLAMMLAGSPADAVCVGVGVGVCGVVGAQDGSVRFAPNLGWHDVPLGRMLAERLDGLPVTVGNDGDLGAMAEHARGAAAGLSDVIYISGEVGVGGGIIVDGRPLRGAGGYGGEVGHMSVNPYGRVCRCGRRGCWETEIGEEAVLLASGAAAWADVIAAPAKVDELMLARLRQVGHWMGVGVVNLVNIFNPEIVVFGGETRGLFSVTEPIVRAALATALEAPREQVRLELAALGADSVVIGAAELAFAPLLDNPLPTTV
jgi:predicted NBD/HSP70 family sugar kinase